MGEHDELLSQAINKNDPDANAGEFFGDEHTQVDRSAEILAGNELTHKKNQDQALRKRYFRSKEEKALPLTTRFANAVKRNFLKVGFSAVAGGALSFGAAYALNKVSGAPIDQNAILKTSALMAVAFPYLTYIGGYMGYSAGHYLNWKHHDNFRHLKTEPAGRIAGVLLGAILALGGGMFGNQYGDAVYNTTVNAPEFLGTTIPSAVVDHFTDYSNTKYDRRWEIGDQAACLFRQAVDPVNIICNTGPGSDAVSVKVDLQKLKDAGYSVPALEQQATPQTATPSQPAP